MMPKAGTDPHKEPRRGLPVQQTKKGTAKASQAHDTVSFRWWVRLTVTSEVRGESVAARCFPLGWPGLLAYPVFISRVLLA